jgi:glutamate racemase
LPYGTKSPESIIRYSLQAAELLVARRVKCLVVACNTASAVALDALRERFAPLPVIGVVEPGAAAGCAATRSGVIAVIATESTVRGGAYQRAIERQRPDIRVAARACSLFVALAEEGWTDGEIVRATAQRYLGDLFERAPRPDTLVLGCTHFPVFTLALREFLGEHVTIVDSAATTAAALSLLLEVRDLTNRGDATRACKLMATDGPDRFASVGGRFLGEEIAVHDVELVDLR